MVLVCSRQREIDPPGRGGKAGRGGGDCTLFLTVQDGGMTKLNTLGRGAA